MVNRILEYCYNSVLIFIFTFANLLILSSVLFFINISISVLHLPVSFIIAIIEVYFLRQTNIRDLLVSTIIMIFIFLISIFLCGGVFDSSYDGNSYHKEAIGYLKEGWNPIYETAEEFGKKESLTSSQAIWLNSYPKTTWFYGASVYKITDNIETSKSFNFIIVFVVFFVIVYLINKYYNKKLLAFLMAILTAVFSIMCQ